ncbi:hypothetical protein [Streptomyces sp. NPDC047028]|uniref:hypothetical protein n=1 Tax=Streptomyces sp. NPDC047028 TaxID=3155793 RepID=UPI0033E532E8
MRSWTTVDDDTKTKAGTVGNDLHTVHKLTTVYRDERPRLVAACPDGRNKGTATEWLRSVNCPACLAIPTD